MGSEHLKIMRFEKGLLGRIQAKLSSMESRDYADAYQRSIKIDDSIQKRHAERGIKRQRPSTHQSQYENSRTSVWTIQLERRFSFPSGGSKWKIISFKSSNHFVLVTGFIVVSIDRGLKYVLAVRELAIKLWIILITVKQEKNRPTQYNNLRLNLNKGWWMLVCFHWPNMTHSVSSKVSGMKLFERRVECKTQLYFNKIITWGKGTIWSNGKGLKSN